MVKLRGMVVPIHGMVAPGFEVVQDEFVRNFTERGELGAACAIYYKVVTIKLSNFIHAG